jgi:DNA polymerase-3 subunit delta'
MFDWNNSLWESLRARVDQIPHAVLFQGPEGVGKLALAERLAARLLCESPTADSYRCGHCDGCRWVASGNHPDLRRVEPDALAGAGAQPEEDDRETRAARRAKPSAEIRVDQIRALSDFLYLGSHRGGRRVAIVHPAESMNVHAANALLKGLEEPPPGAMFLLVTHHPARLLATIRSRCVVAAVPRPGETAGLAWLESALEDRSQARRWLAFAGGAPRLAREYADGERSARVAQLLETIAKGASADLPRYCKSMLSTGPPWRSRVVASMGRRGRRQGGAPRRRRPGPGLRAEWDAHGPWQDIRSTLGCSPQN